MSESTGIGASGRLVGKKKVVKDNHLQHTASYEGTIKDKGVVGRAAMGGAKAVGKAIKTSLDARKK